MASLTQNCIFFILTIGIRITITMSQLTQRGNTLKSCELPTPISHFDQDWLSNPSKNNPNKIYYHYAGSLTGLKRYAEILSPGYESNTLERICLHESWKPNVETKLVEWIQVGFGSKTSHRQCDSVDGQSIINTCHLTPLFNEESLNHNSTKEHVTLTDNSTFVLFVQCWEDGFKDWHAVVPLGKTLDGNSKDLILNHVKSIGFDTEKDIYYAKYDNCNTDE